LDNPFAAIAPIVPKILFDNGLITFPKKITKAGVNIVKPIIKGRTPIKLNNTFFPEKAKINIDSPIRPIP
jgi:hypothetical protein